MAALPSSYLSHKCEGRRKSNRQYGVFALERIRKGELIAVFGGSACDWDTFQTLSERSRILSIQVEENLFLVPEHIGQGDYFNHSCDPNAGLSGQIGLVAMRDIAPQEEICFDYAMSDSTSYDEFICDCGSPNCRKQFTGKDWQIKELQARYAGYFTPYLQRRIDQMNGGSGRRKKAAAYGGLGHPAAVTLEQR